MGRVVDLPIGAAATQRLDDRAWLALVRSTLKPEELPHWTDAELLEAAEPVRAHVEGITVLHVMIQRSTADTRRPTDPLVPAVFHGDVHALAAVAVEQLVREQLRLYTLRPG